MRFQVLPFAHYNNVAGYFKKMAQKKQQGKLQRGAQDPRSYSPKFKVSAYKICKISGCSVIPECLMSSLKLCKTPPAVATGHLALQNSDPEVQINSLGALGVVHLSPPEFPVANHFSLPSSLISHWIWLSNNSDGTI